MKKLFIAVILTSLIAVSGFAKSTKSMVSYYSVPILKVLDSRDAFVVIYQKNKIGTGSAVIPKKWALPGMEEGDHVKLKVRAVNISACAYMSVFKKEGEFYRVVLNVPTNRQNPIWGVLDRHVKVEGSDKDTLEELEY